MLEITIWDVQHGSAAYIKTPNNQHIVVDLGDNGDDFSPIRTLYGRGIRQLHTVVITHPHRDHMDDIANFSLLRPLTLCTPRHLGEEDIRKGNRTTDATVVNQYLAIRQSYSHGLSRTLDLSIPDNFGGAAFQVFTPRLCNTGNLNDHSLVVVVSYAGLKMVIPGDNESPSWNELLRDPSFVTAIKGTDVLLAAHHGRNQGYCADLFDVMGKPRLVVISDGRFGDTSATDRYCKQVSGWKVYDAAGREDTRYCVTTRCDGNITIKFGWNTGSTLPSNFLNVTTSKPNMNDLLSLLLGGGTG